MVVVVEVVVVVVEVVVEVVVVVVEVVVEVVAVVVVVKGGVVVFVVKAVIVAVAAVNAAFAIGSFRFTNTTTVTTRPTNSITVINPKRTNSNMRLSLHRIHILAVTFLRRNAGKVPSVRLSNFS